MSGLLLGILLARTFSGLIAQAAGWRTVYVVAGAWSSCWPASCTAACPAEQRREPHRLRAAAGLGGPPDAHRAVAPPAFRHRGLAFATFNVIWTSLAFLLVGPPYHYSEAVIGLFGLLGAAGALAASSAAAWPTAVSSAG